MKILEKIKSVFKSNNQKSLIDNLYNEYINKLIKEKGFITTDELNIIEKSWKDGYVYGRTYYRNIKG
jgi:cupin superfamily acireductone dioxygenase involved in methionine salvage